MKHFVDIINNFDYLSLLYRFILMFLFCNKIFLQSSEIDIDINLTYIPKSIFVMGDNNSTSDDEKPSRETEIDGFYISKYETTYKQWTLVYNWAITNGYDFENAGQNGANVTWQALSDSHNHPVTQVNWFDAVKWCNALSEMLNLDAVYYENREKTNLYRSGRINLTTRCVDWQGNGYRLPTEAEWEYALKGNSTNIYHWGNEINLAGKFANISDFTAANVVSKWKFINTDDGFASTAIVGSLKPNEFGLYDMLGNVWEWCYDMYGVYRKDNTKNPRGATTSRFRVFRGSSFENYGIDNLRSTKRMGEYPYFKEVYLGFRVAKSK